MVITYKFNDGTVSKVEVSKEIGEAIRNSRKDEHADNEKNRYHCLSLDAIDYEGAEYGCSETVESYLSNENYSIRFYETYDSLTDIQKRRLEMLSKGMSIRRSPRAPRGTRPLPPP